MAFRGAMTAPNRKSTTASKPTFDEASRHALVRAGLKEWQHALVDLGHRNTLLHYRPLKKGTLCLDQADPTGLRSLFQGKKVLLHSLFLAKAAQDDARLRCKAICHKAQENFEERGIDTLFFTRGLATWESPDTARPAAPLLLYSARLLPTARANASFRLCIETTPEINPTLRHLLQERFGIDTTALVSALASASTTASTTASDLPYDAPLDTPNLAPTIPHTSAQEILQNPQFTTTQFATNSYKPGEERGGGSSERSPGSVHRNSSNALASTIPHETTFPNSSSSENHMAPGSVSLEDSIYKDIRDRLIAITRDLPGFDIQDTFILGNFSYAKLKMVEDLDRFTDAFVAHPIVAAVAGAQDARHSLRATQNRVAAGLPDQQALQEEHLILDADSSQSLAVNAALQGNSFVLDGPPGTGKSQTIANLIACLAAQGKSVIFVAEKRAAIDAVLKRVQAVGIAELVLDIHDGAGNRRRIAQSLARTLEHIQESPPINANKLHKALTERRAALSHYAKTLHSPHPLWGVSPYQAQLVCAGIPPEARTPLRFPPEVLSRLTDETANSLREAIAEYAGIGGTDASFAESIWAKAHINTGEEATAALAAARRLAHVTAPAALEVLQKAENATGLSHSRSLAEWEEILHLCRQTKHVLDVLSPAIYHRETTAKFQDMARALEQGNRSRSAHLSAFLTKRSYREASRHARNLRLHRKIRRHEYQTAFIAAARQKNRRPTEWAEPDWEKAGEPPAFLPHMAQATAAFHEIRKELRVLSTWAAIAHFDDLPQNELHAQLSQLAADTETILKLPRLRKIEHQLHAAGAGEILTHAKEQHLNTDMAQAVFDWTWHQSILEHFALADDTFGAFDGEHHQRTVQEYSVWDRQHLRVNAQRTLRAHAEQCVTALQTWPEEADIVAHEARKKTRHLPIRRLFTQAPHVLTRLKPCWAASPLVISRLLPGDRPYFDIVIFDEASQIVPADAIGALLRAKQCIVAGDDRQLPPTDFFVSAINTDLAGSHDDRDDFDGDFDESFNGDIDDIAHTGTETSVTSADSVNREPNPAQKTAPHTEKNTKQTGNKAGLSQPLIGTESILDALSAFLPQHTLSWHYRAKDERLIAAANAWVYDSALTTFPSPTRTSCLTHVRADLFQEDLAQGTACISLQNGHAPDKTPPTTSDETFKEFQGAGPSPLHEKLPGDPKRKRAADNGSFQPSLEKELQQTDAKEEAKREARVTAELILSHAREHPHESLGVITMGLVHAERIEAALCTARAAHQDPGVEAFFADDKKDNDSRKNEPFFVKNLERVQGDEREAIILALGFKKAPNGQVDHRFGALNEKGGERRLNVAITRARRRMTVVSSFGAPDMDPARCKSAGARILRRFLAYAASQGARLDTGMDAGMDTGMDTGRAADFTHESQKNPPALDPFEQEVHDALAGAGYKLTAHYGTGKTRVDLAVQHPDRPGEFILAIECDGLPYWNGHTVRDRDRLRREQLERLGWRCHRVWSTAWFRNKEKELARALAACNAAVAAANHH